MAIEHLIKREAKKKGVALAQLSLDCGRAHSWLERLLAGQGDPRLSDAIRLADRLDLSIIDLAEAMDGRARSRLPVTHAKSVLTSLVRELTDTALRDIDVATAPSVLDRLINWWRHDNADIDRLGELTDYVDFYAPPSANGRMTALSIGVKSLAHRTLPTPDVETLNNILAASAPEKTAPLVEAQRAALRDRFRCDFVELRAPVPPNDTVHIDYLRFLFKANKNGHELIVNYSKEV